MTNLPDCMYDYRYEEPKDKQIEDDEDDEYYKNFIKLLKKKCTFNNKSI